ncbi:MAG: Clp1/GlmU family protein [Anaerolineae bacterium]
MITSYAILTAVTELVIPPRWESLELDRMRGTVMIIGASDTGKSTLARYLFQRLCRAGRQVAYLDLDMGQSTLGLPTTMNLAMAAAPGDDRFPPQGARACYFVGAVTPRGHFLPTIIGAYRLQQKAVDLGAEVVVVDTTGLIDKAQGGKVLKQWKIELLAPTLVIGLQRGWELEPILWPLRRDGRVRSIELPVSSHAIERSREVRIARRQERLAGYFREAQPRLLNLRQFPIYDLERLTVGTLLAFQDEEGFALALGAVEQVDYQTGTVIVRTPLPSLSEVVSVRLGAVGWDLMNRREL